MDDGVKRVGSSFSKLMAELEERQARREKEESEKIAREKAEWDALPEEEKQRILAQREQERKKELAAKERKEHIEECKRKGIPPRFYDAIWDNWTADTPEKMLALGLEGLKEHIKSISFFNNKAANIIKLSEQLSGIIRSNAAWRFPDMYHNRDALMTLGGIGRKTANVITSILWGAKNVGVDTHVFRLAHRFGWAAAADNTPEKVEKKIIKIIPDKYLAAANHLMVMHGRYVCKAMRPDCENCPVQKLCGCKKE